MLYIARCVCCLLLVYCYGCLLLGVVYSRCVCCILLGMDVVYCWCLGVDVFCC